MKEIIKTKNAPSPIGPYNQAIKVKDTLYISGQIPLIPSTMELFSGTIKEETELVMESLKSILKKAGMTFENVLEVRQGKYFDIEVNESDETKAKSQVEEMCKKLLANLVIEDYKIL